MSSYLFAQETQYIVLNYWLRFLPDLIARQDLDLGSLKYYLIHFL